MAGVPVTLYDLKSDFGKTYRKFDQRYDPDIKKQLETEFREIGRGAMVLYEQTYNYRDTSEPGDNLVEMTDSLVGFIMYLHDKHNVFEKTWNQLVWVDGDRRYGPRNVFINKSVTMEEEFNDIKTKNNIFEIEKTWGNLIDFCKGKIPNPDDKSWKDSDKYWPCYKEQLLLSEWMYGFSGWSYLYEGQHYFLQLKQDEEEVVSSDTLLSSDSDDAANGSATPPPQQVLDEAVSPPTVRRVSSGHDRTNTDEMKKDPVKRCVKNILINTKLVLKRRKGTTVEPGKVEGISKEVLKKTIIKEWAFQLPNMGFKYSTVAEYLNLDKNRPEHNRHWTPTQNTMKLLETSKPRIGPHIFLYELCHVCYALGNNDNWMEFEIFQLIQHTHKIISKKQAHPLRNINQREFTEDDRAMWIILLRRFDDKWRKRADEPGRLPTIPEGYRVHVVKIKNMKTEELRLKIHSHLCEVEDVPEFFATSQLWDLYTHSIGKLVARAKWYVPLSVDSAEYEKAMAAVLEAFAARRNQRVFDVWKKVVAKEEDRQDIVEEFKKPIPGLTTESIEKLFKKLDMVEVDTSEEDTSEKDMMVESVQKDVNMKKMSDSEVKEEKKKKKKKKKAAAELARLTRDPVQVQKLELEGLTLAECYGKFRLGNITRETMKKTTPGGWTVFHCLVCGNWEKEQQIELLTKCLKTIRDTATLYIDKTLLAPDNEGWTPFIWAIYLEKYYIAHWYLEVEDYPGLAMHAWGREICFKGEILTAYDMWRGSKLPFQQNWHKDYPTFDYKDNGKNEVWSHVLDEYDDIVHELEKLFTITMLSEEDSGKIKIHFVYDNRYNTKFVHHPDAGNLLKGFIKLDNYGLTSFILDSPQFAYCINMVDEDGNTPIMTAVRNENIHSVHALVEYNGLDLYVYNKLGLTVWDMVEEGEPVREILDKYVGNVPVSDERVGDGGVEESTDDEQDNNIDFNVEIPNTVEGLAMLDKILANIQIKLTETEEKKKLEEHDKLSVQHIHYTRKRTALAQMLQDAEGAVESKVG